MKRKLIFISIICIIFFIALADALDLFTKKEFLVIPHGNHSHYLPLDRDESISVHNFPMEPPKADEMITPDGKIVKKPTK